ncbi:MAG: hypothetical protein AB7O67_04740 [Vicinamibacterales bacterium]
MHRSRLPWFAAMLLALAAGACSGGTPTSPTETTTTTTTTPTTSGGSSGTASVAYTPDVKPVFDADCIRCHNARTRDGGVDLSSYATVLHTLSPGNANSILVRVTRSGGAMYGEFSGNRTAKSELIRSWVVDNGAAQSR